MTIRVGINGFGRIGRSFWRAANAGDGDRGIQIVAANDLGYVATMAHLLKYDTVLGTRRDEVSVPGDTIRVGDKSIKILAERRAGQAAVEGPRRDFVIESTGGSPAGRPRGPISRRAPRRSSSPRRPRTSTGAVINLAVTGADVQTIKATERRRGAMVATEGEVHGRKEMEEVCLPLIMGGRRRR